MSKFCDVDIFKNDVFNTIWDLSCIVSNSLVYPKSRIMGLGVKDISQNHKCQIINRECNYLTEHNLDYHFEIVIHQLTKPITNRTMPFVLLRPGTIDT